MDIESLQENYDKAVSIAEEQNGGVQTVHVNPSGWDALVETDVIDHPYEQSTNYYNVIETVDGQEIKFDDEEVHNN